MLYLGNENFMSSTVNIEGFLSTVTSTIVKHMNYVIVHYNRSFATTLGILHLSNYGQKKVHE
jgi:hypothetical protein